MKCQGFSLVEVALALGVLAFTVVALAALLPGGLLTFRASIDQAVGAQIAQRLASEIQQADFPTLLGSCNPDLSSYGSGERQLGVLPRRFFDDQGTEIAVKLPGSPSAAERRNIIYTGLVRISRERTIPIMEGGHANRSESRNLATATIQVVYSPGDIPIPLTDDLLVDQVRTRLQVQTFPVLLAGNSALSSH